MYDKQTNDIIVEDCGEFSFQQILYWRDEQKIVRLRLLAEALRKSCRESSRGKLYLRYIESKA